MAETREELGLSTSMELNTSDILVRMSSTGDVVKGSVGGEAHSFRTRRWGVSDGPRLVCGGILQPSWKW